MALYEYRHELIAAKAHARLRDDMDSSGCIDILARAIAEYEREERERTENQLERLRLELASWKRQHKAMEKILQRIIDVGKWDVSTNSLKQILRGPEQSKQNADREKKRKAAISGKK